LKHIFSFYYAPKSKDIFLIDNKDDFYRRIAIVLRMQKDDIYICFDRDFIYTVIILEINKKHIINKVIERKNNLNLGKKVIAYIPYLEREYANQVFYTVGQQGIRDVRLVRTDLTQIKEYTEKEYIRFEKLMIQGCEEGRQYVLPVFDKVSISIDELVKKIPRVYWFYENGSELSSFLLGKNKEELEQYAFLCGPERGYSEREINLLLDMQNYQSIKLSNSILKSVDIVKFASIFFRSI
jgi:RsmE family RNA methyltransferase